MNYLGEKPSSRILRPPGGESSNIFGEFDNIPVEKKNPKPTYQSSVFSGDPEPVITKPAAQSGHLSNIIFGTDDDTNYTAKTPNKDSKTRASILFQVSEPSTKIDEAVVDHHISNIPMFSTNTLEEPKRAKKRPVTAPAQKQRSSFNLFANAEHAVDTRPGPGERTKTSTGYKPANANLKSTVFNLQAVKGEREKRHYAPASVMPALLDIETAPRIRTKPLHRNEISSVFPSNDIPKDSQKILRVSRNNISGISALWQEPKDANSERSLCQNNESKQVAGEVKQASDTYQSRVFQNQSSSNEKDVQPLFSADARMCSSRKQKFSPKVQARETLSFLDHSNGDDNNPSQLWCATDQGVINCTRRARCSSSERMLASSIFKVEIQDYTPPLWSSDQNMSSCKSANTAICSDTYKSTLFDPEIRDTRGSTQSPKSDKIDEESTRSVASPLRGDILKTKECQQNEAIDYVCDTISSTSISSGAPSSKIGQQD